MKRDGRPRKRWGLVLPMLVCGGLLSSCSDKAPDVVERIETRLPPAPSGFPRASAPVPSLPQPVTVKDWERLTLGLLQWGLDNASRVDAWDRWWNNAVATFGGKSGPDKAP